MQVCHAGVSCKCVMQVCHACVSCTLLLFEQSESGLVFGQVFFLSLGPFPPICHTPFFLYIARHFPLVPGVKGDNTTSSSR